MTNFYTLLSYIINSLSSATSWVITLFSVFGLSVFAVFGFFVGANALSRIYNGVFR